MFESTEQVLNFAMDNELEAKGFYQKMAAQMTQSKMKEVFLSFAKEEQKHWDRLNSVKQGQNVMITNSDIKDLKMSDYLTDKLPEDTTNIDYQDALLIAMKREKAAFRLYRDLADKVAKEELKLIFKELALEEAKHKLWFEVEYDENYMG